MSKLVKVDVECDGCDSTGLYQGFAECKGEAVVCLYCEGTGCMVLAYRPFVKRRGRRGIKTVRRSGGAFLATGVGGVGREITYREFQKGNMP